MVRGDGGGGQVWDQMSSQWGRNDEVRMGGRREALGSCHAVPVVYITSILSSMLKNLMFITPSKYDEAVHCSRGREGYLNMG